MYIILMLLYHILCTLACACHVTPPLIPYLCTVGRQQSDILWTESLTEQPVAVAGSHLGFSLIVNLPTPLSLPSFLVGPPNLTLLHASWWLEALKSIQQYNI